jgi:hypothetical protein
MVLDMLKLLDHVAPQSPGLRQRWVGCQCTDVDEDVGHSVEMIGGVD